MRRAAVLGILLIALWTAGCGASHRNSQPRTVTTAAGNGFLYVSDSARDDIFGFRIDNLTGVLTPVAGSPFAALGSMPGRLAVDHAQHLLFGINTGSATLSSYVIDNQTGILTVGASIALATAPHSLVAHPNANFVYILSGNAVSGFSYDSNGLMTPLPNTPQTLTAPATQGIAIDSTGSNLFITLQSGMAAFQIGADGALTALTLSNANAGVVPIDLATSPVTNLIFSVGSGGSIGSEGGLFGWTFSGGIGLNAGFTPSPGTPISADTNPVWVTFAPSGTFAYVAAGASGSGQILGYSLANSGLPAPIAGSQLVTPNPAELAVDPSGNFLYSININLPPEIPAAPSNAISGFLIGTAGVLTPVPESPLAIASPRGIAITRK